MLNECECQGCHWIFAKITENLRVCAVSQKMNTKRDRKVRKRKMKQEKIENNGKWIGGEWIGPKITGNRHPWSSHVSVCVCVCMCVCVCTCACVCVCTHTCVLCTKEKNKIPVKLLCPAVTFILSLCNSPSHPPTHLSFFYNPESL